MQNPKYLKRHPCLFIFFPKNAINARINKRTHTHTHTHERERETYREREKQIERVSISVFTLFRLDTRKPLSSLNSFSC